MVVDSKAALARVVSHRVALSSRGGGKGGEVPPTLRPR